MRPISKHRRESALESWAVRWARARGVIVAKLKELDGVPDRIFFPLRTRGRPVIIEFKARGEEPEELQAWYLSTMQKAGYLVAWCDNKEAFLKLMEKYV